MLQEIIKEIKSLSSDEIVKLIEYAEDILEDRKTAEFEDEFGISGDDLQI